MKKIIASALFLLTLTVAALAQGVDPGPGPFVQNGAQINPYDPTTCFVYPATVAGGCQGSGSFNVDSMFVRGVPIGSTPATAAANQVFAGPTSGSPAAPTFRSLTAADIPSLSGSYLPLTGGTLSGTLGFSLNGTAGSPLIARGTSGYYFSGTNGNLLASIAGTQTVRIDSVGNTIFGIPATALTTGANNFIWGGSNSGSLPAGASLTTGIGNFIAGSRAGANLTSYNGMVIIGIDAGMNVVAGGPNNNEPSVYISSSVGKYWLDGGNVCNGHFSCGGAAGIPAASGQTGADLVYSSVVNGGFAAGSEVYGQKETISGDNAYASMIWGGQNSGMGRSVAQYCITCSYTLFAGHAAGFYVADAIGSIGLGDSTFGKYPDSVPAASFTAGQSGTLLTVTAVSRGVIIPGTALYSNDPTKTQFSGQSGTAYIIQPYGTGGTSGTGSTGTYQVSVSQTVASQIMATGARSRQDFFLGENIGPNYYNHTGLIGIGHDFAMSFNNSTVLGYGQVAAYVSGNFSYGLNVATVSSASTAQYTAAQMRGGRILRSGGAVLSDTTDTAANIIASLPASEFTTANTAYDFYVVNTNSGILTLGGGTNVSNSGFLTVAHNSTKHFQIRVTSGTVVELYGYPDGLNDQTNATGGIGFVTGALVSWGDVGLSRIGTGILGLGNGTFGDTTGELRNARVNVGPLTGTTASAGFFSTNRANPATSGSSADGIGRFSSDTGIGLDVGVTSAPSNNTAWLQARATANYATNFDMWLNPNGGLVAIGYAVSQLSKLAVNGTIAPKGYTVSTLPASQNVGSFAYVTDQLTTCAVAGAALTGGGVVTCPAFYNGSAWVGL